MSTPLLRYFNELYNHNSHNKLDPFILTVRGSNVVFKRGGNTRPSQLGEELLLGSNLHRFRIPWQHFRETVQTEMAKTLKPKPSLVETAPYVGQTTAQTWEVKNSAQ